MRKVIKENVIEEKNIKPFDLYEMFEKEYAQTLNSLKDKKESEREKEQVEGSSDYKGNSQKSTSKLTNKEKIEKEYRHVQWPVDHVTASSHADILNAEAKALLETAEATVAAQKIIDEAKREAVKLIGVAEKSAEEIHANAYEQGLELGKNHGLEIGRNLGEQEGQEKIERELAMLQEAIKKEIEDMSYQKQVLLENHLNDLKRIAVAVGEKIVQVSLKSSEEIIERMILKAIEKKKKVAWAKIYIGSKGTSFDIEGDSDFLRKVSKLADNVRVVMMNDAEVGMCIIEMPEEIMDISVTTQLENIKEIVNNSKL